MTLGGLIDHLVNGGGDALADPSGVEQAIAVGVGGGLAATEGVGADGDVRNLLTSLQVFARRTDCLVVDR